MTELSGETCEACRADAPRLSPEEIEQLLKSIPQWHLETVDGIPRLVRTFTFGDWAEALRFTNEVGEIAEEEGHHPAILTEWGKVTVSWWSHKLKGLHRNDVIMAAKTDTLLGSGFNAPA